MSRIDDIRRKLEEEDIHPEDREKVLAEHMTALLLVDKLSPNMAFEAYARAKDNDILWDHATVTMAKFAEMMDLDIDDISRLGKPTAIMLMGTIAAILESYAESASKEKKKNG